MKTYVIWNPEKIGMHTDLLPQTYADLLRVEAAFNNSWSSTVTTDDIKQLVQSVYNETDAQLHYHEVTGQ